MKKITTILAVLFFGMFVAVGSAMAAPVPYWTLADFTAGTDGTTNFSFTFENKDIADNANFGVFFSNHDFDQIENEVTIFEVTDLVGYTAVADFTKGDGCRLPE